MDSLVRNTTSRFSRPRTDGYEPLNQAVGHVGRARGGDYGGQRTFSRPRSHRLHGPYKMVDSTSQRTFAKPRSYNKQQLSPMMVSCSTHKRNRARQRQIFLQTYKLGSMDSASKSRARKLKKFVVKVKRVVVSVLSFMRANTLKSCSSGSVICVSSPSRIVKFC